MLPLFHKPRSNEPRNILKAARMTKFVKSTYIPFLLLIIVILIVIYVFLMYKQNVQPKSMNSSKTVLKDTEPMNRQKIGQYTWGFLHSMIANLPEKPTKEQQKNIFNLVKTVAQVFPCGTCRRDFGEILDKEMQEENEHTRESLSLWLCKAHNLVNEKLEKPLFDCDIKKLDELWRIPNYPRKCTRK